MSGRRLLMDFDVTPTSHTLEACRVVESLAAAAPWLTTDPAHTNSAATIVPLVDTRPRAVARRQRLNLMLTWDSTLVVSPAPPAESGARP